MTRTERSTLYKKQNRLYFGMYRWLNERCQGNKARHGITRKTKGRATTKGKPKKEPTPIIEGRGDGGRNIDEIPTPHRHTQTLHHIHTFRRLLDCLLALRILSARLLPLFSPDQPSCAAFARATTRALVRT